MNNFGPYCFFFQDNLILYHHTKLLTEKNRNSEREYLVGLMFSHFDSNDDGVLDIDELTKVNSPFAIDNNIFINIVRVLSLNGYLFRNHLISDVSSNSLPNGNLFE